MASRTRASATRWPACWASRSPTPAPCAFLLRSGVTRSSRAGGCRAPRGIGAASPAPDPVPIGHNQSFAGLVFGTAEQSQIEVMCAGPQTTGHPMAGQSAEAILVAPPAPSSAGFTGTRASTIGVILSWIVKGKTVTVPTGTLTGYYELLTLPTAIVVP